MCPPETSRARAGRGISVFSIKADWTWASRWSIGIRDDAAGEALDKIAKYLELGYPGGPIVDKLAEGADPKKFPFAIPQMTDQSLDYSFSGLKTAALRQIKAHHINKNHPQFNDFLASFQKGIVQALLANISRALEHHRPKSLILCGGVARNKALRKSFQDFAQKHHLPSFIPVPELCTDNAVMVAALALEKINLGETAQLKMDLNAYPRVRS